MLALGMELVSSEDSGWYPVFHSTEYTMTKFNNMPALYELYDSLWSGSINTDSLCSD